MLLRATQRESENERQWFELKDSRASLMWCVSLHNPATFSSQKSKQCAHLRVRTKCHTHGRLKMNKKAHVKAFSLFSKADMVFISSGFHVSPTMPWNRTKSNLFFTKPCQTITAAPLRCAYITSTSVSPHMQKCRKGSQCCSCVNGSRPELTSSAEQTVTQLN